MICNQNIFLEYHSARASGMMAVNGPVSSTDADKDLQVVGIVGCCKFT